MVCFTQASLSYSKHIFFLAFENVLFIKMYWILYLICRTEAFDSIFKNTIKILYYFINLQHKMFIFNY